MKRELFLVFGLSCGLIICLWVAIDFKNTQETYFTQSATEKNTLQRHLKILEDDLTFLKIHQKELDFLAEKGWFISKSRLIAGEVLEKRRGSLNDVRYTFEPETLREANNFKVTKIVVEVGALLDTDIYEFVESLLEGFPGILRPNEFILEKGVHPNFVVGKLVFEWVSMGGKNDES
ncbi:MAG: hypothetical protein BGO67_11990 [Alphaproteobacteria bacterium 41-28]|nr:MAG: hypothetical protein BGO67_11990 [Alphaproteobacteria bacterium 41-28]